MDEEEELRQTLKALQDEHRALDESVQLLQASANAELMDIARMKKRKLALKDKVAFIEDLLHPDIIA